MTRQRNKIGIAKQAPPQQIVIPALPDKKMIYVDGKILNVSVSMRVEPVYWAFPMDELMFSKFFVNFLQLGCMPQDPCGTRIGTYLPEARNFLHEQFLKTECKWMVMLDSDVMPPPNFLPRLLEYNLPLVGGWYSRKDRNNEPVVYDYVKMEGDGVHWWQIRKTPGEGLEKVDGAGAGVWLMRRDVAEALGPNPYDMEHGGEDLVLCRKVTELGFPIHIDWSIACAHVGVGLY